MLPRKMFDLMMVCFNEIYFSGLSTYLTLNAEPVITIGFFRTYLSGNVESLTSQTSLNRTWTATDAFKLIFEPLFGQDKTGLPYYCVNI